MKVTHFGLALAFASTLGVAALPANAGELGVATFVPPQHHASTVMFTWFGEEPAKRSGGDRKMKLYPAGQLGAGPVQQHKRAVAGVADITFGVSAHTPALFPKTMLAIPPGTANSSADATKRILAVFDEHLADECQDAKVIGITTASGIGNEATRDVSSLEGLNGAKIVPCAALTTPIIEAMAADPVQMPVTEMHAGLSAGTIDGAHATYSNMTASWNFAEVATRDTDNMPVTFAILLVAMNEERHLGLSLGHRAIIDALSGEPASMTDVTRFRNEGRRGLDCLATCPDAVTDVISVSVSAEERARMDAIIAEGLKDVFAEHGERGITNAEEIHEAMNRQVTAAGSPNAVALLGMAM
ncbi:MAG: TRAP transporter substrate-binding protein DctP [Boseongicola sp.]|nr:TRAP transporter substrate-binding protein DctP [Boseongicola sp.]